MKNLFQRIFLSVSLLTPSTASIFEVLLKIYHERTQLLLHFTPFQKKELVISPISRISVIGSFLPSRFLPHKWCSERTCVGYEWIKHLLQPHALGSLCGVSERESFTACDCFICWSVVSGRSWTNEVSWWRTETFNDRVHS